MKEYKYDLAISLLDQDAHIASEIIRHLGNDESIFFYKKNVDELLFKNGVNTFGDVFAKEARFILVLHRAKYGKTDWTALEYALIQDRYLKTLKQGASPILFYKLDEFPKPNWLNEAYIYYSSTDEENLANLSKTIRKLIIDFGGTSLPNTNEQKLKQFLLLKKYNEEFENKSRTNLELANESLKEAFQFTKLLDEKIISTFKIEDIYFQKQDESHQRPVFKYIINNLCLLIRYSQQYTNAIAESDLEVTYFISSDKYPSMGFFSSYYADSEDKARLLKRFYITIDNDYVWRDIEQIISKFLRTD